MSQVLLIRDEDYCVGDKECLAIGSEEFLEKAESL